jgi:hypothetical protein
METRTLTDNARHARRLIAALSVLLLGAAILVAERAPAQEPETAPVPLSPAELEELVGSVALYPDDLLAIVLPASTYPLQIVQAARFLEDRAADATLQANPEWDDSIVALLNYPEIVRMMNEDLDWTWDLGAAVLADQAAVIGAVQAFRDRAYAAGNLQSDDRQVVTKEDEVIEIAPADPEVVYIPYYEPERVVVYHSTPAYYYYPYAYPLYYYPYPVGYGFSFGFFWGVTSAYSIGWYSHCVQVYHHSHVGHPYYHHPYYDYGPYYGRSGVVVNVNTGYASNVWRHDDHHGGPHPQHRAIRVAYEGRGEPRSDGTAYGFARTPSRTAGRSDAGAVTQTGVARQLGAAREGTGARPFAAAPSGTEPRSETTRSTATPERMLGGVARRDSRSDSASGEVRSGGRMLGRVATESPWRSREDFAAPETRTAPRANASRTPPASRSIAPPASTMPRANSAPRTSFTPQSSAPVRVAPAPRSSAAPQPRLGGVASRESAPQQSAPSSGRIGSDGRSAPSSARSGGGRAAPGGRTAQR